MINNAGWTHRNKPLLEVTEEEFDRIYAVNVKAIYLMTQRCVPIMRDQGGGSIINIGSTAGVRPRPGLTWYNGSKGFVNLVSKSLAVELAPMRIRVNCIAPVLGETGLTEAFLGGPATPETLAKFIATIPLGRMSQAVRHRERLRISGERRGGIRDRGRAAGRRRPDRVGVPAFPALLEVGPARRFIFSASPAASNSRVPIVRTNTTSYLN